MQAIGAGALDQAVKAVAIARGFVAPSGMDLICIPAYGYFDRWRRKNGYKTYSRAQVRKFLLKPAFDKAGFIM